MSAAKVLFVFEGERPETNVVARLQAAFPEELGDLAEDSVEIVYASNVYALYSALKEGEGFLDLLEVLKEQQPGNDSLRAVDRERVSQTFLFFDLDIHGRPTTGACAQLEEMLRFFDDETENGKLFLSYPMAEAVNACDLSDGLLGEDRRWFGIDECKNNGFKKFVDGLNRDSRTICRSNCRRNWETVCAANYEKAGWLMKLSSPWTPDLLRQMTQPAIWQFQRPRIERENVVAVLSAFPFFLLEYLGAEKTCALCRLPRNGNFQE